MTLPFGKLDLVGGITKFFKGDGAFLDWYIAALITGSILGMNRKLLVKAAARYFPAIFGGLILAFGLCCGVAAIMGYPVMNAMLGIAALICGALGLYEALRGAKEKDRALRGLPEAEALGEAAWDVWLAEMPKKEEQNDLTFLPINEKTLARKNGDLMILYHLLPEIAVEAWTRIHGRSNIINLNCPEPATQDSGTGGIE